MSEILHDNGSQVRDHVLAFCMLFNVIKISYWKRYWSIIVLSKWFFCEWDSCLVKSRPINGTETSSIWMSFRTQDQVSLSSNPLHQECNGFKISPRRMLTTFPGCCCCSWRRRKLVLLEDPRNKFQQQHPIPLVEEIMISSLKQCWSTNDLLCCQGMKMMMMRMVACGTELMDGIIEAEGDDKQNK